jgi:hypothetical protein
VTLRVNAVVSQSDVQLVDRSLIFTRNTVSAARSQVEANPGTGVLLGDPVEVQATLLNARGNPVPDEAVRSQRLRMTPFTKSDEEPTLGVV